MKFALFLLLATSISPAYSGESKIFNTLNMQDNSIINVSTLSAKKIIGDELNITVAKLFGGLDFKIHNADTVSLTQGDCVYISTTSHDTPLVKRNDSSTGVSKKAVGIIVSSSIPLNDHGDMRAWGIMEAKVTGSPMVGDLLRASTLGGGQTGKLVVDNSPTAGIKLWIVISTMNEQGRFNVMTK